MEVIDIGLSDLEPVSFSLHENDSSSKPSVNFGPGIELLMNDKVKSGSGSTSVDLGDLDKLANELDELSGEKPKSTSGETRTLGGFAAAPFYSAGCALLVSPCGGRASGGAGAACAGPLAPGKRQRVRGALWLCAGVLPAAAGRLPAAHASVSGLQRGAVGGGGGGRGERRCCRGGRGGGGVEERVWGHQRRPLFPAL